MRPLRLGGLALLAVALVAAAVWFGRSGGPQAEGPSEGLLWPELAAATQVERIVFRIAGDVVLETLERHDGRWRVMGHDGWWADAGRVDALLRELGRARKLEAKTAISERHAILGVEDTTLPDAAGTAVEITYGGATRQLLVGNANPHSSGRFVRFANEPQAWLVDAAVDLPADPGQWLDRQLLDIASRRVARMEVTPGQGRPIVLSRAPGDAAGHALMDAPAALAVDHGGVETAATLFEGLRLEDVARYRDAAPEERQEPVAVRVQGVDGMLVDLESWRDGAVRWIRLQVAFDEAVAHAWVEGEIARDRAAIDAARRPAAEGGGAAAAPLDPESAGIGPLDIEQRLHDLRSHAATLDARLQGWMFSLSPRKQAIIEAAYDDYLVPAD